MVRVLPIVTVRREGGEAALAHDKGGVRADRAIDDRVHDARRAVEERHVVIPEGGQALVLRASDEALQAIEHAEAPRRVGLCGAAGALGGLDVGGGGHGWWG